MDNARYWRLIVPLALFPPEVINRKRIRGVYLVKMKLFSRAKKEIVIVCALFNYGCRGTTEFRQEFEVFLCESHHKWATNKMVE